MKPRPFRAREAEVALALGALLLASLVFLLWPQCDLWISREFCGADGRFFGNHYALVRASYDAVPWFGRAIGLLGLVIAMRWWRRPGPLGVRWWRRAMVAALLTLLAVGGLVNGVLKDHWGRARPATVHQFGGPRVFTPAWEPASQCLQNCSFVSGHAATGYALISLGMFGSLATRRRWWLIGMVTGTLIGLGRVAQGGHFASDVVLAGLLVWIACCALRWAWLCCRVMRRRRAFNTPPSHTVSRRPADRPARSAHTSEPAPHADSPLRWRP
jgi:membrane-associated PAP2 superfamily phosphatase